MPTTLQILSVLLLAYLTGSIPTSVWVGKIFFKTDIRDHGSGNAGATNTMRVLGVGVGIPVLLFDMFKGWISVKYSLLFPVFPPESESSVNLGILLGILAVSGHIFPVYAGFRGGKGVASIFGVFLALAPVPTLCAAGVFLVVLLISKYVSLGSVLAGISFPIWLIFVFRIPYSGLQIFSVLVAVLLIFTHRKNISRLLKGEENKADFLFGRKKSPEGDS